jgi:BolA protein
MTGAERLAAIRERIAAVLAPSALEVVDESHLHKGHAGARDGRGHFRVRIIAERFAGLRPLERHRLVYAAVGSLMQTDIHALSVTALTSAEAAAGDVRQRAPPSP